LEEAVAKGRLRHDLLYRLNVMNIKLPPLRERPEDVAPLARLFMGQLSTQLAVAPIDMDDGILADLERYSWPGNVRELRNVVERSLILGNFPIDIVGPQNESRPPRSEALKEVERNHMLGVLAAVGGNRAEAARRLGVSRKTLDRKCAAWNVQ
jgi:DNA-binding NtrC family response regulator